MENQRYPQIHDTKNRLHKKICRSKDRFNKRGLETKVKITGKCYLSLPKIVQPTIVITSFVRRTNLVYSKYRRVLGKILRCL